MHELVPGAALGGEVLLDGRDLYGRGMRPTEIRRRIGMVFQKPNPFPSMTVAENVVAGLKLSGIRLGRDDSDRIGRAVPAPGRAVERGQGPAGRSRAARSRAVSSSGSASPGRWR